jgi:hypothetical protein
MMTKVFSREIVSPVSFQLIKEKSSNPLTPLMNGFTADVSLDGVKITASMPEEEVETLVRQYALIKLSFSLPGTAKAIAATAAIEYFVRGATSPDATAVTFRVSFLDIDHSAQDVIGEFIRQRINRSTPEKTHHFPGKTVFEATREPRIPCFA